MFKIISLLRKPLDQPNLVENIQKWGCGALNIKKGRFPLGKRDKIKKMKPQNHKKKEDRIFQQAGRYKEVFELKTDGRWPANLIIQHHPSCQVEEDGADWICHSECQAHGFMAHVSYKNAFKQIQTEEEVIEYLTNLIQPQNYSVLKASTSSSLNYPLNTYHSAVYRGEVSLDRSQQLFEVLRPGAFLAVIPSNEFPLGDQNICYLEDQGFEVRDSFFWTDNSNLLYYVPKPSKKERTQGLEGRNPHPTVKPITLGQILTQDLPKDETLVEPFTGSGSFGISFMKEGFSATLIEKEEEFISLISNRLEFHKTQVSEKSKEDSLGGLFEFL